jgi:hypothetical protein
MDAVRIEKVQALNSAIENFNACYDKPLWGSAPDGDVRAAEMLEYLIEHPELSSIAAEVARLNSFLSISHKKAAR